MGLDGKPFNTFADLAELDLKDSVDGHSPDSQCITACYAKSFAALNGPVWERALSSEATLDESVAGRKF